jgi:predicted esterase
MRNLPAPSIRILALCAWSFASSWTPLAAAGDEVDKPWCAPELEALPADVCHFEPEAGTTEAGTDAEAKMSDTLVIFLHGLVQAGAGWQHAQQRGFVRAAKRFGFSLLAPRGRNGANGRAGEHMVAWPTSHTAQQEHEPTLLAEWQAARALLEKRRGAPFKRVYVMGFSNGAYYATSLALRGKLDVDGYGVFAGGSGADYLRRAAKTTTRRVPMFVGVAGKDSTAANARQLVRLLRDLHWPYRAETRRVGHAVADKHLEHALEFLSKTAVDAPKDP